MGKLNQIYRCELCGNIVELINVGGGTLVCCGEEMTALDEKSQDQGLEKHVPVIEKDGSKVIVKVGSVPHPMDKNHFIQFIELFDGEKVLRKYLKPGDEPKAEFRVGVDAQDLSAREYCTVHSLWKSV